MYQEFVGKTEEATKWYKQLVADFPNAEPAGKARGALQRLGSVGKPMQLKGNDIQGGTVDVANVRRKAVLIHYWANWCVPCKADMVLLKDFYAKKGGRDFEIIGVCLDNDAAAAKQYLSENRFAWKNIIEPGGLDGRLANEMGVMTLPLMVLIDPSGNVANNNIHVAELESELNRIMPPSGSTANTPRTAPLPPR
jgi:thiol-disulfide isomerase/thioredoxin